MAIRFYGKNPMKKYVKQVPQSRLRKAAHPAIEKKVPVQKEEAVTEAAEENKETEVNKMEDNKLEKVKDVVADKPKRKVKVVKKAQGLYERTEDSAILLTDDNKMVLND